MTLTAPEPTPAHPSIGLAAEARLAPITATRYEVIVGDAIVGSIDRGADAWVATRGRDADAEQIGAHPSIVSAMRQLAESAR